jgi:hypothetical protein
MAKWRGATVSNPTNKWLEKTNAEQSAAGVSHRQRPLDAWRRWALEPQQALGHSEPQVRRIFGWYKESTKADSQQIGPMARR